MQNKNSQEKNWEGRGEIPGSSHNGGEMLPIDATAAQN
jgi:hypothetical protein